MTTTFSFFFSFVLCVFFFCLFWNYFCHYVEQKHSAVEEIEKGEISVKTVH